MKKADTSSLGIRKVISEGFCIGCGACSIASDLAKVSFNKYGELVADIQACSDKEISSMEVVCPFSAAAPYESELAQIAFQNEANINVGDEIGLFNGLYAGYSNTYRKWGSSGGIVSWLLTQLLTTGAVDKVVVVGKSVEDERFFDFRFIDNKEELKNTGTSYYYPVSYDKALKFIVENPGRYAITGVPCFHKALRQLKAVNPLIAERVVYQVGIVCGQMKSAFYLDYLSRKAGANSPPIGACFRRKDENARADDYLFECSLRTETGEIETRSVRNREIGGNWAMGLFKPRACDFCDDVFAETADIAVMDAWLDQYVHDGRGTSLVITRSSELAAMLEKGKAGGELLLADVSESDVVESQRGGLNHRRAGLRYRLLLDMQRGPVPRKRVVAGNRIGIWFRLEQRIRSAIREKSRLAMRKQLDSGCDGLSTFESEMRAVLSLFKWFGRMNSRFGGRRDFRSQFKLDI